MRQTTCAYCSNPASIRVRGRNLCSSHLRQLCKLAGVPVPAKYKSNRAAKSTSEPRIRFNWGFWDRVNQASRVRSTPLPKDKFYRAGYEYGGYPDYRQDASSDNAWKDFRRLKSNPKRRKVRSNPRRMHVAKGHGNNFYIVEREGRFIVRIVGGPYKSFELASDAIRFLRNPRKSKRYKSNPKLGRAARLYYERTIGRHPGNYKHAFSSKPDLFYDPAKDEIVLRGRR